MNEGRYELKFVVDAKQRADFLDACRSGLMPDPHGKDAVYRVSSVYFDTSDFAAFWEKMDGEAVRSKYRLRFYSLAGNATVDAAFMEIKHRIHNTVYKQRLRLTNDGAMAILEDASALARIDELLSRNSSAPDAAAISQIQAAASSGLEAKATITYLREAWMGSYDDRLRVTFDSAGQAYLPGEFAQVGENSGESFLDAEKTILEVKFNQSIPRWIRDILDQQNLVLQRFSKYAEGVRIPAHQFAKSLRRQAALSLGAGDAESELSQTNEDDQQGQPSAKPIFLPGLAALPGQNAPSEV
ncbi:MAG: polyphosphate polymerase domain-containing protein [Planctomycetota bacterium]